MPLVAPDTVKPKKIFLPSSEDIEEDKKEWVVLDIGPIVGDDVIGIDEFKTMSAFKYLILVSRLREWNVTDVNGEVAEINQDTVKRLPFADLAFLMKELDDEAEVKALPKEQPNN